MTTMERIKDSEAQLHRIIGLKAELAAMTAQRDLLLHVCKAAVGRCSLCKGNGKFTQQHPGFKSEVDCPYCSHAINIIASIEKGQG